MRESDKDRVQRLLLEKMDIAQRVFALREELRNVPRAFDGSNFPVREVDVRKGFNRKK